jgi:hypothetical protein
MSTGDPQRIALHDEALSTWGGKSRFGAKGSVVVKWPQAAVTVCQRAKDRARKSR